MLSKVLMWKKLDYALNIKYRWAVIKTIYVIYIKYSKLYLLLS